MGYRFTLSVRGEDMSKHMAIRGVGPGEAARRSPRGESSEYTVEKGEANYGPKIDQMVQDSLKREHQLGTIQLDFQLPRQFELSYVNEHNAESIPVVIHRAIYGSLERFVGILIEHYVSAFPCGSPQCSQGSVDLEKTAEYAREVYERLLSGRDSSRVGCSRRQDRSEIRDAQLGSLHARHRRKGSRVACGGCSIAREGRRRRDAA
jgi:threonyl-tRNA synthetase